MERGVQQKIQVTREILDNVCILVIFCLFFAKILHENWRIGEKTFF